MQIKVKTPSRLHFGILDLNGNLGRIYGSLGLAIDFPNTVVEVKNSEKLEILGYEKGRVISIIKKFSKFYEINPKLRINVKEAIPEHVGLGSGTQLALAIGVSVSRIYSLDLTAGEISNFLRKGNISGIGTYAFESGGFIVDSGCRMGSKGIPQKIFRYDFPKDWKFLVVIPEIQRGFRDSEERGIFKRVIPASQEISANICRLTLMKLIPSLLEKDIKKFGSALTEINRNTGLCFRKIQGGIYRSKILRELINFMLENSHGAGQSSWGPAVFALVREKDADRLNSDVIKFLNKKKIKAEVFVTGADNKGAEIKISS